MNVVGRSVTVGASSQDPVVAVVVLVLVTLVVAVVFVVDDAPRTLQVLVTRSN